VELGELRKQVETFLTELCEEEWKQRAGLKEESRQAEVYERHADLASPALFQEVKGVASKAEEPELERGLRFLLEFLAQNILEAEARELTDQVLSLEASLRLQVEETTLPFRTLEVAIRNEEDRKRRQLLQEVHCRGVLQLNPFLARVWETIQEVSHRLGFPSYAVLCQRLSGIDFAALERLAADLLVQTEDMYADLLKWHLKKYLNVPLRGAKRHDLAHLFRAPEWDASFPPWRMLSSAEATLKAMRVDPKASGRIMLDDEPRPNKSPRAFVAPLKVPDRVIIIVRPVGGWDDYEAYFHELGHALHYAYTDASLPVEFRRLGDPSITEAHAFTIESLLHEEGWLVRFLEISRPKDFHRLAALHRLYLVRRYAAKLAYELSLHDGSGLSGKDGVYRECLSRATLAEFPKEFYLYDVDPHFYAARYLRAWLFEAALRALLYERFDEEWYRNDRTGPFLEELWGGGQRETLEELAEKLGLEKLSLNPFLKDLLHRLE